MGLPESRHSERMSRFLQATTDDETVIALDPDYADQPDFAIAPEQPGSSLPITALETYIRNCWQEAQQHRRDIGVDDRLEACLRAYKGEYDAATAQEIAATGGADLFRKLTMHKADQLGAWIRDVLAAVEDRPWDVEPTIQPELPPQVREQVITNAMQQAYAQAPPDQLAVAAYAIASELSDQVADQLKAEAEARAEAMGETMQDILQEGGWAKAFTGFVDDYKMYPNAFVKGPVVRIERRLSYAPDPQTGTMRAQVTEEPILVFSSPSPWDIYPSPHASSCQDGYILERGTITRRELHSLRDQDGYRTEAIEEILKLSPQLNPMTGLSVDNATDRLDLLGKPGTFEPTNDAELERIEFWGTASGQMLEDWGLPVDDVLAEYDIMAVMAEDRCVKAIVNPDPLGQRPYSTTSFKPIKDSFWGQGLPEVMEDIQTEANANMRALCNNLLMSSGPMMSVDVNALPPGYNIQGIGPWYIHQYDGSKLTPGHQGINFTDIPCNVGQYMTAYQEVKREADDVTGIPAFIAGSGETRGAGETARGLAMLMNSASKNVKEALARIGCDIHVDVLQRLFTWLMIYHPDETIKGDCQIKLSGPLSVIAEEHGQMAAGEFLKNTNNPVDLQIMGADRRANVLRRHAQLLDMPEDDVVPPADELRQRMAAPAPPPEPMSAPQAQGAVA